MKNLTHGGAKDTIHVDMGTLGVGNKRAHFMYDKSNKNMHRAPQWWRDLEKEIG